MKSVREKLFQANIQKDMGQVQKYGNMLIRQDPYNEELYQEIMEIYAAGGNYNMAIKLYYDLEKTLSEDLGWSLLARSHSCFTVFSMLRECSTDRRELECILCRKNSGNLSDQPVHYWHWSVWSSKMCGYCRRGRSGKNRSIE